MKTLRFSLLLAVSLLIASTLLQTTISGYLIHYTFYVKPGDFVKYNFNICGECRALVSFYVYGGAGSYSDIMFRVLAPDGREIYPRTKIYSELRWSFTAAQGGNYTFEFDNTYSTLTSKWVDLALAVIPPLPPEPTTLIIELVGFSVALLALGVVIGYTLRRVKR